ncbi:MAG: histidine kinase dimerization/phospho-acceptor domain-containing protein, partial [Pseudomonadota bacterium]|nr:histidine kinase dimerization/phospho-acceptor domain-containing protein [Pseudomonadota bacterium]
LDILATVPGAKNIWKNLLSNDLGNVTIPLSINRESPDNDDNVIKLSLHLSVLKKTPNRKNSIVIFIEDLSLNETLGAADQYYTDSLENLVDEKSKELEFIHEQLILSEKKAAMIETSGAVAHELRQPLTAIIGAIELLATDDTVENNPRLNKRFKTIRKQSLRMAEIITQMEQLVEYKTRSYINGSLIVDLEKSSQNK